MTINAKAIVDCRNATVFQAGHCLGAASIPAAELAQRMHELPKTSEPLGVYGDEQSLDTAVKFLTEKGYQVCQQWLWTPALLERLRAQGQLATGTHSQRLWQPAPLVASFVTEWMPAHGIIPSNGLDIGCGAGRDLVYLAMHGWAMTGIDYIPAALQRVQQLAASQHCTVTTWECDLETGQNPFATIADGHFGLVCVARYLHRPLFPWLKRIIKPGGILIYQTFMQGAEQFGSPRNPKFLLKPGELAAEFANANILLDDIEYLDDGRPVSAFICQL
jgi:SAM-dependent methyltransferase